MLEFLDGTDLHNRLRLLLRSGTKMIVVVEGEDDFDLLVEAFENSDVELVPGYGKPKTLEAAREAEEQGTNPVRFLIDADFDHLTGADAQYPSNLVATTHYDLAMDALEHLSSIVPRIARLASAKDGTAKLDVAAQVELVYRIAEEFGAVRYVSQTQGWFLACDDFPFHQFLPAEDEAEDFDLKAVVCLLVARTKSCTYDPGVLHDLLVSQSPPAERPRLLVNSHDLFDILQHVGKVLGGAKSNTRYETQFKLAAAGEIREVPVVRELLVWAAAA